MSAGFERIVEFLFSCLHLLKFWFFVSPWEQAVVVDQRRGQWDRTVGPGLRWKMPFGQEEALIAIVIANTLKLDPQSLTTKDGVSITLTPVVKFTVTDVRQFLLEVEGAQQALAEAACGPVGERVAASSWEEVRGEKFSQSLTTVVRRRAKDYGVYVDEVSLKDLVAARVLRLVQEAPLHSNRVHSE